MIKNMKIYNRSGGSVTEICWGGGKFIIWTLLQILLICLMITIVLKITVFQNSNKYYFFSMKQITFGNNNPKLK
jgi:hypothetical protein